MLALGLFCWPSKNNMEPENECYYQLALEPDLSFFDFLFLGYIITCVLPVFPSRSWKWVTNRPLQNHECSALMKCHWQHCHRHRLCIRRAGRHCHTRDLHLPIRSVMALIWLIGSAHLLSGRCGCVIAPHAHTVAW